MPRALAVAALVAAIAAGCAHGPLARFFKKPYVPYAEDPAFSFERPRKWRAAKIERGVEVREPRGRVSFSVEFIPKGDPAYKAPELYKQYMAGWGSVEDAHIVTSVEVSSRTAYRVVFTRYEYDARYLIGEQVDVSLSEVTLVPDPAGNFVVRYQAPRDDFYRDRYRTPYLHFVKSLALRSTKEED